MKKNLMLMMALAWGLMMAVSCSNADNAVGEDENEPPVEEPQPGDEVVELDGALALLAGTGEKTWTWGTECSDGYLWGNMGYCNGAGRDIALNGYGHWWGVQSEEDFYLQLQHTDDGQPHGDESPDASMVFTCNPAQNVYSLKCYNAEGQEIRTGEFAVEDYDTSNPDAWRVGYLLTTPGAILWPYEINSGGNMPTKFDIVYLTEDNLVLVYPDGGEFDELGGWGEATYWNFKKQ